MRVPAAKPGRPVRRALRLGQVLLLLLAGGASPAQEAPPEPAAEDPAEAQPQSPAAPPAKADAPLPAQLDEPSNVETPVFSPEEVRYLDAIRLRLQSQFIPSSDFEGMGVALYRPHVSLRVAVPLSKRAVIQLTGRFETSRYQPRLVPLPPPGTPPAGGLGDFYSFQTGLQGAVQVNDSRFLFVGDERWSLLGDLFVRSRWEEGAFSEAVTWGGSLAPGYEIPRFRIAVGVRVQKELGGGGVELTPVGNLRWIPTNRITLRNRGLGLQLEYRLSSSFELFAAGYTDGTRYLLRQRAGLAADATLRDDQVLAGVGFEWRVGKHLRFNLEGGVVARRTLEVELDEQTVWKRRADPAGYADIRIEIRP